MQRDNTDYGGGESLLYAIVVLLNRQLGVPLVNSPSCPCMLQEFIPMDLIVLDILFLPTHQPSVPS